MNKKEQIEVLTIALTYFSDWEVVECYQEYEASGICKAIYLAILQLNPGKYNYADSFGLNDFGLMKFKPLRTYIGGFWFPINHRNERSNILKQRIAELKNEL